MNAYPNVASRLGLDFWRLQQIPNVASQHRDYPGQNWLKGAPDVKGIRDSLIQNPNALNNSPISGWRNANGTYYIGDGHHRFAGAYAAYETTGDRGYIDRLLANGVWTAGTPPAGTTSPLMPLLPVQPAGNGFYPPLGSLDCFEKKK